jgi:hypothetical protein
MRQRPLLERLLEKLVIDPNGCWIFTGSIDPVSGYGKIQKGEGFNFPIGAHVASWMVHHEEPPRGIHVLHRCNVRACCNPKHLYLGIHRDNMHDKRKNNLTTDYADWADERPRPQPSQPSLLEGSEFARKFEYTFAVEELDYPWEEGEAIAKKYIETWERSGRRI